MTFDGYSENTADDVKEVHVAKRKTKTYRWIAHEDGDMGKWHLTNDQMNFLTYLQNNDFLRPDLEFYRLHEEDDNE